MLCSDGHGAKNISLSISDENYEVSFVSTHQNINTNILTCRLLQNRNSQVFSSEGNADAGPKQELHNSTMIVSVSNNTNGHKY